ncbi:MAG TPA: hypothetical protein VGQ36_22110 [Thermoanaerobaculia bacterium]|jgi:hypothetical protein|nr:hypothetical protein [Thermoanaerobaculia bacterium]
MNELQELCETIAARVPEAEIAIDEPLSPTGAWWANISRHPHHAVVEWKPGRGFGISNASNGGYGEGPDAVVVTAGEALDRVLKVLDARQPAAPVR